MSDRDAPTLHAPRRSGATGDTFGVRTGSRLHFGLLDTVAPFGGVGVMIDEPATVIVTGTAHRLMCDETLRPRVLPIAQRLAHQLGQAEPVACRIKLTQAPPRHTGFGSGTQFALAVAETIARMAGYDADPQQLALQVAGRGLRSAVGIHGYFAGGLICERSDGASELNPISQRIELPKTWRVGLFLPREPRTLVSGSTETEHFTRLAPASSRRREALERLLFEQLLPAAAVGDFEAFADAVTRYNRCSGELFAEIQGGPYHGQDTANLVAWLLDHGARGVGQSSWGPGVFAWFPSAEAAERFQHEKLVDAVDMTLSRVRNQPRELVDHEPAVLGPS